MVGADRQPPAWIILIVERHRVKNMGHSEQHSIIGKPVTPVVFARRLVDIRPYSPTGVPPLE